MTKEEFIDQKETSGIELSFDFNINPITIIRGGEFNKLVYTINKLELQLPKTYDKRRIYRTEKADN